MLPEIYQKIACELHTCSNCTVSRFEYSKDSRRTQHCASPLNASCSAAIQGHSGAEIPYDVPLISEVSPVKRLPAATTARSSCTGRLGRLAQGRPAPSLWVRFTPWVGLEALY